MGVADRMAHRFSTDWLPSPTMNPARWALALVLLALLAHAPALPMPGWIVFALALGSGRLPNSRWVPALRLIVLTLSYLVTALAFGWLDATTLRLNLLLVLALKWAESRTPREFALVSATAMVAVAIGLLQWGEGIGLALVMVSVLLLLAGAGWHPGQNLAAALRAGGRQLLLALPLAGVLFLFFPRVPGPLWDIGLTFGLPLPASVEKSNQGLGISTRLKPGQTQTGATEGQPVLVAEFENWVPPTSQLYWRGPVFYDFDGHEWHLDADYSAGNGRRIMGSGWRRGADFANTLQSTAQQIRYKIRLTPHNGLWLYGLDLPSKLTAESFIGPDWQVLSHTPVDREIHYELSSWLEWTAGGELAPAQRDRATALPRASNPRLRALGESLRQRAASNGTDIPREGLVDLANGGFKVRDRFEASAGEHALDAFWFETREGNSEFFAAAFVVLMRSAGVPARLVTGYRGGKLMALTDYVVVKRSHAHAWAEVWDERKGWRRIDPTDIIAPEKFAGTQAKPKTAPQAAPAQPQQPKQQTDAAAPPPTPGGNFVHSAAPRPAAAEQPWKLPDLGDWMGRWVFRLNAEQQKNLLGGKSDGFAWLWLLAFAAAASTLTLAASLFFARWRESRRRPAAQRAWDKACRQLARHDLAPSPGECPSSYAHRVGTARPAWAGAMAQLAETYTAWRYGPAPEAAAPQVPAAARLLINRILAG